MPVEIQPKIELKDIDVGKLPPYWNDKEVVQGLYNSIIDFLQQFIDTAHDWINGSTISNAEGKNLDDIGYEYNVPRQGLNDDDYRLTILIKMASYSDSGTTTDVIRFVRSAYLAAFCDITNYPYLAFGTMRVEGALIDEGRAKSINDKVTSASRVDITFDISGNSFVPACLISNAVPEELIANLDPSGTDTIGVTLDGGFSSTLGYITEDSKIAYPAGRDRASLTLGRQGMTILTDMDGNPIELITDGGIVPLEILLDTFVGGRYLSSLPVQRTI